MPKSKPNNQAHPATKADLAEAVEKMERLLTDQADVILEAVDERMDRKLNEKFDPVITKLDLVLKDIDAHHDEDIVGAEQIRRHDDQLQKHEVRITKLEIAKA